MTRGDYCMDNISFRSDYSAAGAEDNSPGKRSNGCDSSEVSPASSRRKHRASSRKNKNYSIHPMSDIEAYGKGLDLHELNQKELLSKSASPRESRKQRTSSVVCPSGVGLKTLDTAAGHTPVSFDEATASAVLLEERGGHKTAPRQQRHPRGSLTRSASVDVAGSSPPHLPPLPGAVDAASPPPPAGRPASGQRRRFQQRLRKSNTLTGGSSTEAGAGRVLGGGEPAAGGGDGVNGGGGGSAMDVDHLVDSLLAQTAAVAGGEEEGGEAGGAPSR